MAPHSSPLAWKIPWMEEPDRLQSMRSLRVGTTEQLHFHFSLSCIGEGNGNPLQCSCLENPGDGGAWWAAIYGVTQSGTRLKGLSSSSSSSSTLCDPWHCSLKWLRYARRWLWITAELCLMHSKLQRQTRNYYCLFPVSYFLIVLWPFIFLKDFRVIFYVYDHKGLDSAYH